MSKRRFRVPHTLVLLFGMCVVALIATHVLPQGEFAREVNESGREQVVPGSYARIEGGERLNPLALFTAIPRGFAAAEEIIFFVFLIGGAFGVLRATGAIDAMIAALLRSFAGRPHWLVIGGVLLFALGSSTIGMAEEYLPFVPVLVALCVALGFDAVTAVGIMCCGYSVGYGVAVINPFTVVIAQNVAGLEPTSGIGYRLVLTVFFVAVAVHHVWRYAARVRRDPTSSLVAGIEPPVSASDRDHPFTAAHGLVLAATALTLGIVIHGLGQWSGWGWYVIEMGAAFIALVLVISAISRLHANRAAEAFCTGAGELTTTALLIGFARSIQLILDDGKVVDTIIHGIAQPLQSLGSHAAATGMLIVQSICNFFIPSGSGQAYVTMPIMAPLADLVGVERQVAVLAYQFGDGFSNILVPTSVVLMGILTIARVPYDRWLRFVIPFMLKVWLLAAIALVVGVAIGYA